VEKINLSEF